MNAVWYYENGVEGSMYTGLTRPDAEKRYDALTDRVDEANKAGREAGVKLLSTKGKVLAHYRNGVTEGFRA
jgi:hypothetical protein